MDIEDTSAWAQCVAQPLRAQQGPAKDTWVRVKSPALRANGLPSKRVVLTKSKAPKYQHTVSVWTWRGSTVRVVGEPFDSRTQFSDMQEQYFIAAYIPRKFTRNRIVWGSQLWFQFDTDALCAWMSTSASVDDPETWFYDFLETFIAAS